MYEHLALPVGAQVVPIRALRGNLGARRGVVRVPTLSAPRKAPAIGALVGNLTFPIKWSGGAQRNPRKRIEVHAPRRKLPTKVYNSRNYTVEIGNCISAVELQEKNDLEQLGRNWLRCFLTNPYSSTTVR